MAIKLHPEYENNQPCCSEDAIEEDQNKAMGLIVNSDQMLKVARLLNMIQSDLGRILSISEPAISHSEERMALSCFGMISEIAEESQACIENFMDNATVDGVPINEQTYNMNILEKIIENKRKRVGGAR